MPQPSSAGGTIQGAETTVGTNISFISKKSSIGGITGVSTKTLYVKQQVNYTGPNAGSINLVSPGAGGDLTLAVWSPTEKLWKVKTDTNFFGVGLNQSERESIAKKLNNDLATKTALRKDLDNTINKSLSDTQKNKLFPTTAATKPENSPTGGPNAPNSGSAAAANGAAGASGTPAFTEADNTAIKDLISKSVKSRTSYPTSIYRYPLSGADLNSNDFIEFKMVRYIPNDKLSVFGVSGDGGDTSFIDTALPDATTRQSSNVVSLATINLPVPGNMQDSNPVNWASSDLNALEAYGAQAAVKIMGSDNGFKAAGSVIKDAGNKLKDPTTGTAVQAIAMNTILKGLLGKNLLTRSTGAIVNPNSELLFTGPSLRTFQFTYRMTPRSENEANEVKKIIRVFKQGSSVKKAANGIFLASPNVFTITPKFVTNKLVGGKIVGEKVVPHPFLNRFKLCALTSISVNYTPDGSYMTYANGSMVSYEMSLSFSELDPIFDDDYTSFDGDNEASASYSIGY